MRSRSHAACLLQERFRTVTLQIDDARARAVAFGADGDVQIHSTRWPGLQHVVACDGEIYRSPAVVVFTQRIFHRRTAPAVHRFLKRGRRATPPCAKCQPRPGNGRDAPTAMPATAGPALNSNASVSVHWSYHAVRRPCIGRLR